MALAIKQEVVCELILPVENLLTQIKKEVPAPLPTEEAEQPRLQVRVLVQQPNLLNVREQIAIQHVLVLTQDQATIRDQNQVLGQAITQDLSLQVGQGPRQNQTATICQLPGQEHIRLLMAREQKIMEQITNPQGLALTIGLVVTKTDLPLRDEITLIRLENLVAHHIDPLVVPEIIHLTEDPDNYD